MAVKNWAYFYKKQPIKIRILPKILLLVLALFLLVYQISFALPDMKLEGHKQLLIFSISIVYILATILMGNIIYEMFFIGVERKFLVKRESEKKRIFTNISGGIGWNPDRFRGLARNHLGINADELMRRVDEIDNQALALASDRGNPPISEISRVFKRMGDFLKLEIDDAGTKNINNNSNTLLIKISENYKLCASYRKYLYLSKNFPGFIVSFIGLILNLGLIWIPVLGIYPLVVLLAKSTVWIFVLWCAYYFAALIISVLRKLTEPTDTHFDDLVVTLIERNTVLVIFFLNGYLFFDLNVAKVELGFSWLWTELTAHNLLLFGAFVCSTISGIFIWRHFIMLFLRRWARQTHQKYDDVFVEIANWIGTFAIVSLFVGLFIATVPIHDGIKGLLLPYSVGLGAFTLIIGAAMKESVQNFFSGVLLQIDKPFEIGDRLLLDTGEICDVRDFGMRSTTMYDVLANTELSVPNALLTNMTITNISRPDSQLRIGIDLFVSLDQLNRNKTESLLEKIEINLVALAYSYKEITFCNLGCENSNSSENKNDIETQSTGISLRNALTNLDNQHSGRMTDSISAIINGPLKNFEQKREATGLAKCFINPSSTAAEWNNMVKLVENKRELIKEQIECFADMEMKIYDLKRTGGYMKPADLDSVVNAMSREPVIHSSLGITSTGNPYVKISLNCFAKNLERKLEVTHQINKSIEILFLRQKIGLFDKSEFEA